MGNGALAAKVGSRLAHAALPMVTPSPAMVASALGAHVVGPAGLGGAGASAVGAGIGRAAGTSMISLMDMIPIITTGVIASGAPDVMLGPGQMAVFAPSLPQPCVPHLAQPIPMGSPTVSVHGMQLVRVGDKTTCGAFVCDGVKTVVIGGPATPPPPLSMRDVAGALGAVALGTVLEKTGAVEAINEFGTALAEKADQITAKVDEVLNKGSQIVDKGFAVVDKTLAKAENVVDKGFAIVDKGLAVVDKTLAKAESVVDKGLGIVDKTLATAENVVDKATGTAGAALGKFGEMIGSVGSALEAILGGAGLAGQKK